MSQRSLNIRFVSERVMLTRLGWMAASRSGRISSLAGRGRGASSDVFGWGDGVIVST
jgi:hypothetical protein